MKGIIKAVSVAVAAMSLVACGGGGGGNSSTGGVYFTHEQLADEFIRRVNVDVAGYDLELVKANTLQYDYIVVYDYAYGTYDAYWLGNYNPGENLYSYLTNYEPYFYYDLIPQGGNTYKDYYTGILFTKTEASSKDLGMMQSLGQEVAIKKKAADLVEVHGFSKEVALDVARFAYNLKHSAPGTYTMKDYDSFAKEVTGSTITEFQDDYKSGNVASLAERIERAGKVSGMGSAGVSKFVSTVFFGKNN